MIGVFFGLVTKSTWYTAENCSNFRREYTGGATLLADFISRCLSNHDFALSQAECIQPCNALGLHAKPIATTMATPTDTQLESS